MRVLITPVTGFQQNSSLVWSETSGRGAVIDPGGDLDQILAAAKEHGVTIEKLLVTHAHIDHAGGTAELARKLGNCPIEGPQRDDQFWIDMLGTQGGRYGIPGEPFTPTRWLEQGDVVTVGDETLEVLHCPGHTPGHVVFFHREARVAFVGDVLFQGSIGRTDFPRGDYATLIASIRERLWPLGDDVTFVPGHGPTSTFGYERQTNPFVGDDAR